MSSKYQIDVLMSFNADDDANDDANDDDVLDTSESMTFKNVFAECTSPSYLIFLLYIVDYSVYTRVGRYVIGECDYKSMDF